MLDLVTGKKYESRQTSLSGLSLCVLNEKTSMKLTENYRRFKSYTFLCFAVGLAQYENNYGLQTDQFELTLQTDQFELTKPVCDE